MKPQRRKTGMVLGKFLPPHLGHVYLVEFAREYVDDLTIVVGTLRAEPIPGEVRHAWMRELFPDARVIHLTDENPQHPHEHPDFWDIWQKSLLRVLPAPPECVFASEPYGHKLAEILGAEFIPVDPARSVVPVSGTAIRQAPLTHFSYLPRCVRPYFARRVCVFGPESTGKTTLCRELPAHFQTVMVPEYARTLLEAQEGQISPADIPRIARGQAASEDALLRNANRVIFCDTDLLATTIWSDTLFGDCPAWLREKADERTYDLYLLTDVDVPWETDPVRYLPATDDRARFMKKCEDTLRERGRPYLKLSGPRQARLAAAISAVEAILDESR